MYDVSMFPCIYSNISYVWHLEHEILLTLTLTLNPNPNPNPKL